MLGWKIYKVTGHSMLPTLQAGQYVLAKTDQNIYLNDIVVFHYGNQQLIKRVTGRTQQGFLVAGDNDQDSYDKHDLGIIPPKNILAKAVWY